MSRQMQDIQRENLYKKLSVHRHYGRLTDRQKELLDYLAYGMTFHEVARMWHSSRTLVWQVRNQIIRKLGFFVFENGKSRTMNLFEVEKALKGGEKYGSDSSGISRYTGRDTAA